MAIDTKTPLALYKANLELVLRLGTLLQENRRRWNQLGTSSTSAAIERTLSETERMLTSNDWSSLAAMPGEEFWKSIRDESGPLQGTAQAALANQTAFAEGLREAFTAWQQQSVDALGQTSLPLGKFNMSGIQALFQGPQTSAPINVKQESAARPKKAKARKAAKASKSTRKPAAKSTKVPAKKKKAVAAKPAAAKKRVPAKKAKSPGKRR